MAINRGIYLLGLIGFILSYTLAQQTFIGWAWPWVFMTLSCVLYALAYNDQQLVRLAVSSLCVSFVISSPFLFFNLSENYFPLKNMLFISAFPVLFYIAHAFHSAGHQENSFRMPYAGLFAAVWNTVPLILSAMIFSQIGALLIFLSVMAFQTVGFELFYQLYHSKHFLFISNGTLFFIGLAVAQQNTNIIYNMRFLLLRMMYLLYPFLALVSTIFCAIYLVRVIQSGGALPSGSYSVVYGSLTALITLTTLGILFFNATFQDGKTESGYATSTIRLLKIYRIALFIMSVLMFRAIFQLYPLDPNANMIIICLAPVLYCLVYALSAFRSPEHEKSLIITGNVGISLLFALSLLIINNPFSFGHYRTFLTTPPTLGESQNMPASNPNPQRE